MIDKLIANLIIIIPTLVVTGALLMPLTIFVLAGMLRQLRSPASSVTWLLTIMLVPIIGIPLYWFFGERKFRSITASKVPLDIGKFVAGRDGRPGIGGDGPIFYANDHDVRGNRLKLHANGEEAFADLMQLIQGARQTIEIQTYVLKSDAVGREIFASLIAKAKQGVKVRLLVDGLGSLSVSRRQLRALRRASGEVHFILPVWRFALLRRSNLRNHRKIAVFDGERVFAGGRNLAEEYLGPTVLDSRWSDLSFVLAGPSVAFYAEIFRNDWQFASGEELPPPHVPTNAVGDGQPEAIVRVVPSGPDVLDDTVYLLMLRMVLEARDRVWIVTPYFIPNETLNAALRAAARRGLDVRVVVPAKGDQILPDMARGPYLRDLKAVGAKILLYEPSVLHGKALLTDDKLAAVGSANFDQRSMFLNFEVTSLISSPLEIAGLEAWMLQIMAKSRDSNEAVGKFRDTLQGVARLLTPLL